MADAYIGEIRMFTGDFAPSRWLVCEGQILPIVQYTALFSLIGTVYGGNGKQNFALPDLRGRTPLHQGQGLGVSPRTLGETGGSASVTLLTAQMPSHNHIANGVTLVGTSKVPANNVIWSQASTGGREPDPVALYGQPSNATMNPLALGPTGGASPHNNMQPFLAMRFIICYDGIFPPRP